MRHKSTYLLLKAGPFSDFLQKSLFMAQCQGPRIETDLEDRIYPAGSGNEIWSRQCQQGAHLYLDRLSVAPNISLENSKSLMSTSALIDWSTVSRTEDSATIAPFARTAISSAEMLGATQRIISEKQSLMIL